MNSEIAQNRPEILEWSTMKNYEGYEIAKDCNGDCYFRNKKTKRMLKPAKQSNGYYVLNLKNSTAYIHKLIATQYLENTENYTVVDHIDRNRGNNNINNLVWCSVSDNNVNRLYKGVEVHKLPENSKQLTHYQARNLHTFSNYYYGDNKLFRKMRENYYEELIPTTKTQKNKKYLYYSLVSREKVHVNLPIKVLQKMCENL